MDPKWGGDEEDKENRTDHAQPANPPVLCSMVPTLRDIHDLDGLHGEGALVVHLLDVGAGVRHDAGDPGQGAGDVSGVGSGPARGK